MSEKTLSDNQRRKLGLSTNCLKSSMSSLSTVCILRRARGAVRVGAKASTRVNSSHQHHGSRGMSRGGHGDSAGTSVMK